MRRRELLTLGAGVAGVLALPATRAKADGRMVLYVSARDCHYCREWEQYHRETFVQGLSKNGIGWRELEVTTLHDVKRDSDWPAEIKWVRDANPAMKGTPWFFVINGRTIEKAIFGTVRWQTAIAPLAV